MPSLVPTLADLEASLDAAREEMGRTPYIDSTKRMEAEQARLKQRIQVLESRIEVERIDAEQKAEFEAGRP